MRLCPSTSVSWPFQMMRASRQPCASSRLRCRSVSSRADKGGIRLWNSRSSLMLSLSSPGWQRRGLFRVASCFMVQSREGEKVPRERGGFSSSSPRTSITPLEARGKVNWREIWGVSHRLGICFPCLQIQVFVDGQRKDGFVTNGEPQKEIDATLQAAGVKLPKSAKKCYQVIDLLSGHDAEGWVVPRPPGQSERGMIVSRGSTKMRSHKSQHVDAPVLESTLTDDEVIAVVDPTHPLHGRSFPILRLCQAIHGQGFVEVR